MQEQRGLGGLRFVDAIRKDLTSRLPEMAQMLEEATSDEVSKEIVRCKIVDGSLWDRKHPGSTLIGDREASSSAVVIGT